MELLPAWVLSRRCWREAGRSAPSWTPSRPSSHRCCSFPALRWYLCLLALRRLCAPSRSSFGSIVDPAETHRVAFASISFCHCMEKLRQARLSWLFVGLLAVLCGVLLLIQNRWI